MGLKLKLAVLLDVKLESTTLPCSFLLTYIFELRILIWVREIPDCIGKFDPKRNNTKPRPILVHFVRMSEVSNVLTKRGSLKRPHSVKPIMSKEQQKIESILLKERWNLRR